MFNNLYQSNQILKKKELMHKYSQKEYNEFQTHMYQSLHELIVIFKEYKLPQTMLKIAKISVNMILEAVKYSFSVKAVEPNLFYNNQFTEGWNYLNQKHHTLSYECLDQTYTKEELFIIIEKVLANVKILYENQVEYLLLLSKKKS